MEIGRDNLVEFPFGTAYKMYQNHKKVYGDFNIVGQMLKLQYKIFSTNFEDEKQVKQLKYAIKEIAKTLEMIVE